MLVNEEAKRSKVWQIVMTVSSVLIVLIAIFFLFRMFHSNPLEGTWNGEDSDIILTIKGNGTIAAKVPEALEGEDIKLKLEYTIDKEEKTISIEADDTDVQKVVEDSKGRISEDTLQSALGTLLSSFDYSVDHNELTLTDREFGDQITFVKE